MKARIPPALAPRFGMSAMQSSSTTRNPLRTTIKRQMIIKGRNDRSRKLAGLYSDLTRAEPESKRAESLRRRIAIIKAGSAAEKEVAYLLDFALGASEDFAVIHDLRLKEGDRVAQIDHLVIHVTGTLFVIETKSVRSQIRILENGEFQRYNTSLERYEGMPSPLQQNERHKAVIENALARGHPAGALRLESLIAVSSAGIVERPATLDTSRIVKADMLVDRMRALLPEGAERPFKTASDLKSFAAHIVGMHQPLDRDLEPRSTRQSQPVPTDIAHPMDLREAKEGAPAAPRRWLSGARVIAEALVGVVVDLWLFLPGRLRYYIKFFAALMIIGTIGNWMAVLSHQQTPRPTQTVSPPAATAKPAAAPPAVAVQTSPGRQAEGVVRKPRAEQEAPTAKQLREAEECMARKRYDCAIEQVAAILRKEPGNARAIGLKQQAEREQRKAMDSITIN